VAVRVTARSMTNGNGQSNGQGPDATQRDWELTLLRASAETFWKYV
jgi:hypothetical protein